MSIPISSQLCQRALRSAAAFLLISSALAFDPAEHYGESWTPDDLVAGKDAAKAKAQDAAGKPADGEFPPSSGAEADLREWVGMGYRSGKGRPLPLTGNWMCELPKEAPGRGNSSLGWDPAYFIELVKTGHHVLPTFIDPFSFLARAYAAPEGQGGGGQKQALSQLQELMERWRPVLEYCREHRLPIAFRGHNYLTYPQAWEHRWAQGTGESVPLERQTRFVVNGKVDEKLSSVDPLGPLLAWKEMGRRWSDNPLMKEVQKIYPNPPAVFFLDNNEAGKISPKALNQKADRFVEKYGTGPHDEAFLAKVLNEGYSERLQAMFDGFREGAVEPAWRNNLRFVAYNNLAAPYDGGMPEFYDNDWQPAKTDFRGATLQSDAMNMFAFQERVFDGNPNFHWSTIIWDGSHVSEVWRSRGRGVSTPAKPFQYASAGQRWDFDRYEGNFQLGLWIMRPKEFREFRGDPQRNAYNDGAWQRVLAMVDRPWHDPLLRDFWQNGELVPNRFEPPVRLPGPTWTEKALALDRWFLLKSDANPPRGEWVPEDQLKKGAPADKVPFYESGQDPWREQIIRVFAIALVKGEAPSREWMIYAHSPLEIVAGAKVQLPGFGDVLLDVVPRSGSFFVVKESDRSVTAHLRGGPEEILISTDKKFIQPGAVAKFQIKPATASPITAYTWEWGNGKSLVKESPDPVELKFDQPGADIVTVTGKTADGRTVVGQTEIFVGPEPAPDILYQLPMNGMFSWRGPWGWTGENAEILLQYSHLPNAGSKGAALVVGGKIVSDPERGNVLELSGDHRLNEGVWLAMDKDTVLEKNGYPARTISFWFKANSTQPRQILYADGSYILGTNIYLLGGKLYAGTWKDQQRDATNWISSDAVKDGVWHHVTLVLDGASNTLQPDKLSLYLDGKLAGRGPGMRIPASYCPPRLGGMTYNKQNKPITVFHDKSSDTCEFAGRLSDFVFSNKAEPPK